MLARDETPIKHTAPPQGHRARAARRTVPANGRDAQEVSAFGVIAARGANALNGSVPNAARVPISAREERLDLGPDNRSRASTGERHDASRGVLVPLMDKQVEACGPRLRLRSAPREI
jgi:hypothetical protein